MFQLFKQTLTLQSLISSSLNKFGNTSLRGLLQIHRSNYSAMFSPLHNAVLSSTKKLLYRN
ncbi:hypothetical protein Hanom_Chr06g00520431 [Helianthus anomalus]